MRKKAYFKRIVHDHPDRIFVSQRSTSEFREWIDSLREDKPLILELGMGSGDFLVNEAKSNPDYFYLGVEIKEDRLYKAYRSANLLECGNIAFLQDAAENLLEYNLPLVETIYIFFPDPWPKNRHSRRRMTSGNFLSSYSSILSKNGCLRLKTDDQPLFQYSKKCLDDNKWKILEEQHHFATEMNSRTYYERLFLSENKPIFYLKATASKNL